MVSITKIGAATIGAVIVLGFGALGVAQYQTDKQLTKVVQAPVVEKVVVVVTPTTAPTATPSAVRVYTPVVKGAVTK